MKLTIYQIIINMNCMLAVLSASYKEYKLGVCQLKVSTSYSIVKVKKIEQCFRYKNKGQNTKGK